LSLPSLDQPFLMGFVPTSVGKVPRVGDRVSWVDRFGAYKARWGIGRMTYTVEPGLYALGSPGRAAPVLVTANYKMTLDRLRQSLPGRSAWLLVLDTKGINVWCAAGKGTFGTEELVRRIANTGLKDIVSHRELILPQLAAPGVAAHEVKRLSGFSVTYGPIRCKDLPAFLDRGRKATHEMRVKTFPFWERVGLIPVELVSALKGVTLLIAAFFVLSGLFGGGKFLPSAVSHGYLFAPAMLLAVLAGAVLTPIFLPWLPGRAFSLKGLAPGLAAAAGLAFVHGARTAPLEMGSIAWVIQTIVLSSYLAMNFTGCSTFTSLSGVKKEMRWSMPFQIFGAVIGLGLWLYSMMIS
jgi:hypothetical protein